MANFFKIVPKSPDPNIKVDTDLTVAKLGDVNYIISAIQNAPTYASNAAAVAAGLQVGELFKMNVGPYTTIAIVV